MKIDVNAALHGIDGTTPLLINPQEAESPALTVADVLINAMLTPPTPPDKLSPQQSAAAYTLAIDVYKAQHSDGFVEISAETATNAKTAVNRLYGPLVFGQISQLLDGK